MTFFNFRVMPGFWAIHRKRGFCKSWTAFVEARFFPGRSYWNWSQAAAVVAFSENMSYIAYTYNEKVYGRDDAEVDYRDKLDHDFYDGKMADPLSFLRANEIDAVLIWPEDNISDQLLGQFQTQLGPEFFYIDCKMDGPNNAGLFCPPKTFAGGPRPVDRRHIYRFGFKMILLRMFTLLLSFAFPGSFRFDRNVRYCFNFHRD